MTAMMPTRTAGRQRSGTSGGKAASVARWLTLAAAPIFATMALVCAATGNADPICSAGRGIFRFGSMEAMYLVMSVFHLPPWLRLVASRAQLT
jgi:hypothetical protein